MYEPYLDVSIGTASDPSNSSLVYQSPFDPTRQAYPSVPVFTPPTSYPYPGTFNAAIAATPATERPNGLLILAGLVVALAVFKG